jgi:hypothetical protein
MRPIIAAVFLAYLVGCSGSISTSYQLGTDQEPTSAIIPAGSGGQSGAEGKAAGAVADPPRNAVTAGATSRPKTPDEIRAGQKAAQDRFLFFLGLALMAVAGVMLAAKVYAKMSLNPLFKLVASQPVWLIGAIGLGGAACFAWSVLPAAAQVGIAVAVLLGFAGVIYLSWKASHKAHMANGGGANHDG